MKIRRARLSDMPAVGRLAALLVATHHEFDRRRFMAPTAQTPRSYARFLGTQLEVDPVIVLVAEEERRIVGYTYAAVEGNDWMSLRGPAGVLHDIVVDPKHRGKGTGLQLLTATISELAGRGVPQVVLSTAARNEAAQRLFERAGFRPTMIEMTRDLPGPGRE